MNIDFIETPEVDLSDTSLARDCRTRKRLRVVPAHPEVGQS